MVRVPLIRMRCSACHLTARASTRASTSRPAATKSSEVMLWVTRSMSCSMIGPSSRSAGDVVGGGPDQLHAAGVGALIGLAPLKLGRKEWWMLMIRPDQRAHRSADSTCM